MRGERGSRGRRARTAWLVRASGRCGRWYPLSAGLLREFQREPDRAKASADSYVLLRVDDREGHTFTGEDIEKAYATTDQQDSAPVVAFEIETGSRHAFGAFTERNRRRGMAIVLDGRVESVARIKSRISHRGQITRGSDGWPGSGSEKNRDLPSFVGPANVKPDRGGPRRVAELCCIPDLTGSTANRNPASQPYAQTRTPPPGARARETCPIGPTANCDTDRRVAAAMIAKLVPCPRNVPDRPGGELRPWPPRDGCRDRRPGARGRGTCPIDRLRTAALAIPDRLP